MLQQTQPQRYREQRRQKEARLSKEEKIKKHQRIWEQWHWQHKFKRQWWAVWLFKYLSRSRQCEKNLSQIYTSDYRRKKASTSWTVLKIDTGAVGNTLPVFTIRQMYGYKYKDVIQRSHNVRLTLVTAYNGQDIPCLGSISISIKKQRDYIPAKFYVVDVPGLAIAGVPMCERLELITINCNAMKNEPAAQVYVPVTDLKSVQDLKKAYPKQLDTLGDFKHPAKLFIKKDVRPFIDPPNKCPVHVKKKLKTELKKKKKKWRTMGWSIQSNNTQTGAQV